MWTACTELPVSSTRPNTSTAATLETPTVGSIDRINTRIDDLRKAGLEYLVLGR
jgi:hypothetical protein